MAKMPDQITVKLKVIVKFRWRDILKIRLAGFKNTKHLVDVKTEQPKGYVASPFSDEPDPRRIRRGALSITPPGCPKCGEQMEHEKVESWEGFTCYQCDCHTTFMEDSPSENTPQE